MHAMMPKSTHPRNWSSYENPLDSMQNKRFLAAAIGITACPEDQSRWLVISKGQGAWRGCSNTNNINSASKHLVCRLFRGDE